MDLYACCSLRILPLTWHKKIHILFKLLVFHEHENYSYLCIYDFFSDQNALRWTLFSHIWRVLKFYRITWRPVWWPHIRTWSFPGLSHWLWRNCNWRRRAYRISSSMSGGSSLRLPMYVVLQNSFVTLSVSE